MDVLFLLQRVIVTIIGYGLAIVVLLRTFIAFVKSPVKFFTKTFLTRRDVMPSCLNDPSLGNHDFIHLEDVRLHYVVKGTEGKPLMLFLHGFPEFWYSWRYQIKEFSKDYRVVAVDQRGYGDSDKPSGKANYAIEKLAGDVKQLILALGYEKCVLVSHDWGGAVAWKFATTYPSMLEKLVVCNAPHPATFQKYLRSNKEQFKKSWYMLFFQVPFVPEFVFQANDLKFIELLWSMVKNNRPSKEDLEAYKYTFCKKGAMTGPLNYYRAAFSKPHDKNNTKIQGVPTLVIWGDPDTALNTELAELARPYVTDLKIKVIKDSCHFVMIDKPKETNDAIREFLGK